MHGWSHCCKSSRRKQCPLHRSVPWRLDQVEKSWESGRNWRNRLANTDTELPQRCSNTRRFASGRFMMACRPSSRTPGSRTKSSQLRHVWPQEPQARNTAVLAWTSSCSISIRIIPPQGERRYGKLHPPADIFPSPHLVDEDGPLSLSPNSEHRQPPSPANDLTDRAKYAPSRNRRGVRVWHRPCLRSPTGCTQNKEERDARGDAAVAVRD